MLPTTQVTTFNDVSKYSKIGDNESSKGVSFNKLDKTLENENLKAAKFTAGRLSFNPQVGGIIGGIVKLITAPVNKFFNISPPAQLPKNTYCEKFEEVVLKKGYSINTKIPGFKNFDELKNSVNISMLASNDSVGIKNINGQEQSSLDNEINIVGLERLNEKSDLFSKLPSNLKEVLKDDGAIRDPKTGLVALVTIGDNSKIHVTFGGTGAGNMDVMEDIGKSQMNANIDTTGLFTSHVPPSYLQAAELVGALKKVAENNKIGIDVSGFSKGGGEAAFAGIYNEVKTLSHCGTALSPACQRMLGTEKISNAVKNNMIFNTSVQGDLVSDSKLFNNITTAWEKITGLQVTRHIGMGLRITNHSSNKDIGKNQLKYNFFEKFLHFFKIGDFKTHGASRLIFKEIEQNKAENLKNKDAEKMQIFKGIDDLKTGLGLSNRLINPDGGRCYLVPDNNQKLLIIDFSGVEKEEKPSNEKIKKYTEAINTNIKKYNEDHPYGQIASQVEIRGKN
jgi:hypothetical protein